MTVQTFDNIEYMFATLRTQRQAADSRVQEWQENLKEGDYFVRYLPMMGLIVYGYVEGFEYEEDKKLYDEPHMKHYRFTKCFSVMCPEGEFGDIHVSTVSMIINEETFEKIKMAGWPSDLYTLATIIDIQ